MLTALLSLDGEGNGRGEVGERLADPGAALEKQDLLGVQVRDDAPRQLDSASAMASESKGTGTSSVSPISM